MFKFDGNSHQRRERPAPQTDDLLGRHDEAELVELNDVDVMGGTTTAPCVTTATFVSTTFCPTTKCTKSC